MSKKISNIFFVVGALAVLGHACNDTGSSSNSSPLSPENHGQTSSSIQHVLLLSVDGLHASDLARFVGAHRESALARLSASGSTYANAYTTLPSDSFPGMAGIITGASPRTSGIYYDVSYDRALSPPGSDCSVRGSSVAYDESIDLDPDMLDGGGGINAKLLPRDPSNGCAPVYPHRFLRVNTIFEVVHEAGLRTAWSDKHLSYDFVQGPSGKGVDDLYSPEINANPEDLPGGITSSVIGTQNYDDGKVQAVLNEIAGKDHTGTRDESVPALFGMNFQAVSVAQKLSGYADATGTPSADLEAALEHTDHSIGRMLQALDAHGALATTAIIVTAKHGQSPIDVAKRKVIDKKLIPAIVAGIDPTLLLNATLDDIGMLWLRDAKRTAEVVSALQANSDTLGLQAVYSGQTLPKPFVDPGKDSRAPDIVIRPLDGVIYSSPMATKLAEHGGFSDDDRHVALLVHVPAHPAVTVSSRVSVRRVAPTVLKLLGLPVGLLEGARTERTQPLN